MATSRLPDPVHDSILQTFEHFGDLSDAEQIAITGLVNGPVRHARARTDIVREGDASRVMRLFVEGWGARYRLLQDGRRQVLSFIVAGDLCEPRAFMMDTMDHSIAAVTPMAYVEFDKHDLEIAVRDFPGLNRALWRQMMLQATIQREWTVSLGCRTALERIAHLFCEMFHRLRAVGLGENSACSLPVSQIDIGDAMGLSYVHVNRTLQELRHRQLISLESKELRINDLKGLEKLGLFDPEYLRIGTANPKPSPKPILGRLPGELAEHA
jgi:CRP-like cAMP-binding protein